MADKHHLLSRGKLGCAFHRLASVPGTERLPLLRHYFGRALKGLHAHQLAAKKSSQLAHYLRRAYPQARSLSIRDFAAINSGWENEVYSFTLNEGPFGSRAREELILRIYPGYNALERANKEIQALEGLHRVGYPVPRVFLHDAGETSPFGLPFLLMERIQGRPLADELYHSSSGEKEELIELFCSLLARLHEVNWRAIVPEPERFEPAGQGSIIEQSFAESRSRVESLLLPGFWPTWDWLFRHQGDIGSTHLVLAHLDYHPGNLLLKEHVETLGESAVVIDWTCSEVTDFRFDLAYTLMIIGSFHQWELRDKVLREYERQSGKIVAEMDYFDAIASFLRLLAILSSLTLGPGAAGMRPGSEQMIRGQASAVRRMYEHLVRITGLTIPEVEIFLETKKA